MSLKSEPSELSQNKRLVTPTFILGFSYNFLMGFVFSNNALYPLYVDYAGGGAETIGWFMGIFSLFGVLGRPIIGYAVDRFGVKPLLMLGSLCLSLPCIGYLLTLESGLIPIVWILRLIQGIGWGAHMTAFFTLAALAAPDGRRNEAVAMYGLSGLSAVTFGPFAGEKIIDHSGLELFFLVLTIFGIAAFLLVSQIPVPKQKFHLEGFNLKKSIVIFSLPKFRYAFLFALCHAISFSTFNSFLAPLSQQREIESFSLFFTAFSISGVLIRFAGSRWGDRFGVLRVMLPGFISYTIGLVLLQLSWNLSTVIVAGVLCGLSHGVIFPAVTSLGYAIAPPNQRGSSVGLVTGMMDLGNTLTAILLGQIAGIWGYSVIFYIGAFAPITAATIIWLKGKSIIADHNAD